MRRVMDNDGHGVEVGIVYLDTIYEIQSDLKNSKSILIRCLCFSFMNPVPRHDEIDNHTASGSIDDVPD